MPRPSLTDPQIRARWRTTLHEAGMKCTEQRLAVLHELALAKEPVSHREMLERLAQYSWDPATTFRNLSDLCEAGLVTRIDAGDHVWRFELRAQGPSDADHPHFLCVTCGAIVCLHQVAIADALSQLRIPRQVGAVREVLLKGTCADCA
jgi:Fur family ferric uptake transcriptional regulator